MTTSKQRWLDTFRQCFQDVIGRPLNEFEEHLLETATAPSIAPILITDDSHVYIRQIIIQFTYNAIYKAAMEEKATQNLIRSNESLSASTARYARAMNILTGVLTLIAIVQFAIQLWG